MSITIGTIREFRTAQSVIGEKLVKQNPNTCGQGKTRPNAMKRFEYLTCCVESDGHSINAMRRTARGVSFRTFAARCNWQPWARSVGYSVGSETGLKLKEDFHPAYFKSSYRGKPCYYVVWSAIECIFT